VTSGALWIFLSTYLLISGGTVPQEQTTCQKAVQEVGGVADPPGAYVPQCDDEGEFTPLQFHASSAHSWCVTRDGNEIPGTRTPAHKPPPNCPPFTGRTVLHTTSLGGVYPQNRGVNLLKARRLSHMSHKVWAGRRQ